MPLDPKGLREIADAHAESVETFLQLSMNAHEAKRPESRRHYATLAAISQSQQETARLLAHVLEAIEARDRSQ